MNFRSNNLRLIKFPQVLNNNIHIIILTVFLGLHQAILIPNLTLFATSYLQFSSTELSIFLLIFNLSGVIISLGITYVSDFFNDTSIFFKICTICAIIGYMAYIYFQNYAAIILVTVFLIGPSSCQNSLFFSELRRQSNDPNRAIISRGIFSASWVIGPIIGAFIIDKFLFHGILRFLMFINICIFSLSFFKRQKINKANKEKPKPVIDSSIQYVIIAFFVILLLLGSNVIATNILPIVLVSDLGYSMKHVGIIFSICAIFEVISFWGLSKFVKKLEKTSLMKIGAISGVIYYLILAMADNILLLMCGQIFNALFTSISVGIGMVWFQDSLPSKPGLATGIFMNIFRLSTIFITPFIGIIPRITGTYQETSYASVFLLIISLILLKIFELKKNPNKTRI